MNLNENIQRIKEMMGIITESVSDIKSILKIGSNGGEVEALQELLGIHRNYYELLRIHWNCYELIIIYMNN